MIFLTWSSFKVQVLNKALLRWNDRDLFYSITYEGFETSVLKDSGSDQADFETYYKNSGNKSVLQTVETSPFSAKVINGKKLYKRVIGITAAVVSASPNDVIYTATLTWAKMKEIQIVGSEVGDKVDLRVLDTATGTYSGYPNTVLNQFGFNVNLPSGFYSQQSEFDADVFSGLQLKFTYTSVSDKTIGINLIMNEVV
jgi:hypothetical protein